MYNGNEDFVYVLQSHFLNNMSKAKARAEIFG